MADTADVIAILGKMGQAIEENAAWLTELDAAVGDSDHGINMARGFKKVEETLPSLAEQDIGAVLKRVGMTLVSTVGGASGPLYGTAFLKASAAAAGKHNMDMKDFLAILDAAIGGVAMRGKAVKGEKTMLDAMYPACDAMKAAFAAGEDSGAVLAAGVKAAQEGVEYTKTIIATKGRASYLGERTIGHPDPGAASFTLMLRAIAENVPA